MTLIIIAVVLLAVVAAAYLLMTVYPAFGRRAGKQEKLLNSRSLHYSKGKFAYPQTAELSGGKAGGSGLSILRDFIKGNPRSRPAEPLQPQGLLPESIGQSRDTRVTWFGHSAVLLEMDGVTLFLDPMLGNAPSPFPFIGGRRYSKQLPLEISRLPQMDAVVLSHDHYDHLDYGTIRMLKDKVGLFIVPLGVGAHLRRWGVSGEKIREQDWGDTLTYAGITFTSAPARHFSGRSLLDRNTTLWCSWIIQGEKTKVFFSGDSGYGPHFAEIGRKYGPFDLTLMECGQYDPRWADIHMLPEQTVEAHIEVRGDLLLPIHWGAFTLSMHDWTDPVERILAAAARRGVRLATPRIGETVTAGAPAYPDSPWWR
ncbi:MBL fold metallo-hydrolase [Paenibacillus tritici]|uniref:MBL fold metallo-hydrolase n=1 Tax=Paenibacillus tritici TaxID=1873425 RepID=A0ABX2DP23_9BACL|nr:MBL fold metallo-hydrolase [Paenibacillus tritici]NQX46357.1 MBL fold metallo-hydrolase [Paenibacillus tritici]QUL54746.1 MBL fold metallo-hydrolase [Paenibacillus tritici]